MPEIGTQQSPICINTSESLRLYAPKSLMEIGYDPKQNTTGVFKDSGTGHGNLIVDAPYPTVVFNGNVFCLRKVHVHLGSEHLLDSDQPKDYEVHLVHLPEGVDDPTAQKVVIGILYEHDTNSESDSGLQWLNDVLKQRLEKGLLLNKFDTDDEPASHFEFNPLWFFPKRTDQSVDTENWIHYQGSLTSDPYSEDVSWFVMTQPSKINKITIAEIEKYAEQHARSVCPLNRRLLVRSFA